MAAETAATDLLETADLSEESWLTLAFWDCSEELFRKDLLMMLFLLATEELLFDDSRFWLIFAALSPLLGLLLLCY